MACQTGRFEGLYQYTGETRRQEVTGVCQYDFKVVHLLPFSDQPADNRLSSRYPFRIYYTDTPDRVSSLAVLCCAFHGEAIVDTMWVGRRVYQ
jgi:hypothetical protein